MPEKAIHTPNCNGAPKKGKTFQAHESSLESPKDSNPTIHFESRPRANVELKKSLGFLNVLSLLLGNVGGASIFIAPTTVLIQAGSPGLAVLMWLAGGLVTLSIAISVCELALLLPHAGGPYIYTLKVFGNVPAFIILWGFVILIGFSSWALASYTGALYVVSLVSPDCPPSQSAIKLLAAWLLVTLVALNCTYTSYVARFQSVFTTAKAAAMLIIIIAAITTINSEGTKENLASFMDNSNTNIGEICLSIFAGYFSYGGWQIVTVLMEEVRNPVRDVPRALVTCFGIAILLFVLTNLAYYMVLTPREAMQSDAVAMAFGRRLHPSMPYLLAALVTLCCIGSINVVVMGQPRILYAAARLGHMPSAFALLHRKFLTPWPATVTMFFGALYMLLSGTVSALINYISLYVGLMLTVLLSALIYLRLKHPDTQQTFKVPLPILIGQAVLTLALVSVSVYEKPHELGGCLLLLLSAVPVYFVCIVCLDKVQSVKRVIGKVTDFIRILFNLEFPSTFKENLR